MDIDQVPEYVWALLIVAALALVSTLDYEEMYEEESSEQTTSSFREAKEEPVYQQRKRTEKEWKERVDQEIATLESRIV